MRLFLCGLVACCSAFSLTNCDKFAAAGSPVVTQWISHEGGLGLEISQQGNKAEGQLFLLTDDGEHFSGFLAIGLHDKERNALLFPLKTVTLMQVGSTKRLIKSGKPYLEVSLDFPESGPGERIVGKWRSGNKPPEYTREFERYRPIGRGDE